MYAIAFISNKDTSRAFFSPRLIIDVGFGRMCENGCVAYKPINATLNMHILAAVSFTIVDIVINSVRCTQHKEEIVRMFVFKCRKWIVSLAKVIHASRVRAHSISQRKAHQSVSKIHFRFVIDLLNRESVGCVFALNGCNQSDGCRINRHEAPLYCQHSLIIPFDPITLFSAQHF